MKYEDDFLIYLSFSDQFKALVHKMIKLIQLLSEFVF